MSSTPRHAGYTHHECPQCMEITKHQILEIPPQSSSEKHTTKKVCLNCAPFQDDLEE